MRVRGICLAALGFGLAALFGGTASGEDPNPASISSTRGAWPLHRQWTVPETRHFAAWIGRIYDRKLNGSREQRLAKLEQVLTDPDMNLLLDPAFAGEPCNPQIGMDSIRSMHGIVDCQKLMVSLGAYYSCRRGLPFMISHVRAVDGTDVRTAPATIPGGTVSSFDYASAHQFFCDAVTGTCTGNLRVEPFSKNSEISDTCPVAIDREHLIPGCVYYLDGHVLVLARVDTDGGVRFLDATTSPTRDLYVYNGLNAVTGLTPKQTDGGGNEYAGCFRGFRTFRWPIAETDDKGKVKRVRRRTDAEMAEFGFSTEQYDKMAELAKTGKIAEDGMELGSIHQFIRHRLRADIPVNLAAVMRTFATEAQTLLAKRGEAVQAAWADVQKNGPVQFPGESAARNIHKDRGRWGQLSTALDDAEFRARYFDMVDTLDAQIQWYDVKPDLPGLDGINYHAVWNHSDLAWAVMLEKHRIFSAVPVEYTDSRGAKQRITLLDVEARLYDLSFDPNHPPELRWGAKPGSAEAATAPESPTPGRGGKMVPMEQAYAHQACYRALTRMEIEETPLLETPTEGFYKREIMDDFLWPKWHGQVSPPLVPHGGRAAYLAAENPSK